MIEGMMKPSRLFLERLTRFLHSIVILGPSKCLLKSRKNTLQVEVLLCCQRLEGTIRLV